jgi:hypothetical protein
MTTSSFRKNWRAFGSHILVLRGTLAAMDWGLLASARTADRTSLQHRDNAARRRAGGLSVLPVAKL